MAAVTPANALYMGIELMIADINGINLKSVLFLSL